MTSDECERRAAICAANAAISTNTLVSLEYLRMAAQWRAMGSREIFLGSTDRADHSTEVSRQKILPTG
jgi:hypothetical protein